MENKAYHTFLVSEKVLTITISHYAKNSSLLSSYYEKKAGHWISYYEKKNYLLFQIKKSAYHTISYYEKIE